MPNDEDIPPWSWPDIYALLAQEEGVQTGGGGLDKDTKVVVVVARL